MAKAPYSVQIGSDQLKKAQKILAARIEAVGDFSTPLHQIAEDFYLTEQQWFDAKGGGTWKPLSKSYAAWKKAMHPGMPIMQLYGRMYEEFTGVTRGGVLTVTKNTLTIRPVRSADYWQKHQKGIDGVPQRRVLSPVLELRKKAWHDIVTRWLTPILDL